MVKMIDHSLDEEMEILRRERRYRGLNQLESPQAGSVRIDGNQVVMLSSNNYLGLANHERVKQAAIEAIQRFGCGTASVRIISGYTPLHRELEAELARLAGYPAAITYLSCSAANEGLIASLVREGDVVLSDQLNHASIIDGCRLSRATTVAYPHQEPDALDDLLRAHAAARRKLVVTDGVFSMEGSIAPLPALLEVCRKHGATLVVDESHAVGVLGKRGGGAVEHFGLEGEIDAVTGTLGKALGGACGGYVAGSRTLVDYLYQQSRPIIFSNSLPPVLVAVGLAAMRVMREEPAVRAALARNTAYFRGRLQSLGFGEARGMTPIIPIIVGETERAYEMSRRLLEAGVFVRGFGHPVVPEGQARLRVQISAAHRTEDLDFALDALARVGRALNVVT